MVRSITAVVVGYLAMFAVVFLGLSAGFMAMGSDWAYEEGTYDVTTGWIVLMFAVGVVAAITGGIVCAIVSKHSKGAVLSLAGLVLVLGLLLAVMHQFAPEPPPEDLVRAGDVPLMDAAGKARQPDWVAFANPFVGAVGVFVGAMLGCPRHGPGARGGDGDAGS